MAWVPNGNNMDNEQQSLTEAASVPTSEEMTNSDGITHLSETTDDSVNKESSERVFSQSELDDIVSKRLARAERKWERAQAAKLAEMQSSVKTQTALPPIDQFETPEAYAEALAEKRAQELVQQRELVRQQTEIMEKYHDREEEARIKYADFEQVAYNPNLPVTDAMAAVIRASEIGPELAYHLGSNPSEAQRISKLSPFLQAKEIGRIEAKLLESPPVKKTTSAPAPIKPVTARGSNPGIVDTTDPRSIQTMSTSEWIEAERRRQITKKQALKS